MRAAAKAAVGSVAGPALVEVGRRLGLQAAPHRLPLGAAVPLRGRFAMGCADLAGSARLGRVQSPGAFAVLDAALTGGITAFDTAAVYGGGMSERILGAWIRARGVRDEVCIIGKGGHPDAAGRSRLGDRDLADDLQASLRRMRTDRIDLYLLHRDDPATPVGPIVESLHRFVQQGRVGAIGASNWSHARIEEANRYATARGLTPFTASSCHLSLAEMHREPWPGCTSLTGQPAAEARAWYRATQVPLLAWSPLSGGFLTARGPRDPSRVAGYLSPANEQRRARLLALAAERSTTPEQLALTYLLHQDLHVLPVIAASTPERLRQLLGATDLHLTAEDTTWLELGDADLAATGEGNGR